MTVDIFFLGGLLGGVTFGAFGVILGYQFGLEAGLNERRDAIAAAKVARAEAETKLLVLQNKLRKLIEGEG